MDFWEYENLSGLSLIWLISTKFTLNYTRKGKMILAKIRGKWESGLTTVWLKQDPPVTINNVRLPEADRLHTVVNSSR